MACQTEPESLESRGLGLAAKQHKSKVFWRRVSDMLSKILDDVTDLAMYVHVRVYVYKYM